MSRISDPMEAANSLKKEALGNSFRLIKKSAAHSDPASFAEALREGIAIQSRFVPEPHFKHKGVGFMRSVGVSEIHAAKLKDKAVAKADNVKGKK